MERGKPWIYALGGFALGVLLTSAVWLGASTRTESGVTAVPEEPRPMGSEAGPSPDTPETEDGGSAVTRPQAAAWDLAAIYTGGDTVSHQGRRYRAKWWTQGEEPGGSDVWEDLGILDGEAVLPEGVRSVPINASAPRDTELTDFKVVGYYPSWKPDKLQAVDFSVVTHVCYAFAIPTAEGGLRDLENPETARTLIRSAHENGAKVLLSVGGWSYNDVPLEGVFMQATADSAGVERLAESILAICEKYGFDGVDMDWEHPRVDGTSARQYEALILALSDRLHAGGKLLTAAVLSGATADGNVYYDAAAHSNAVLNALDFINVMPTTAATGSGTPPTSSPWTAGATGRRPGDCLPTRWCWGFPSTPGPAGRTMGPSWRVCRRRPAGTMFPTTAWRSITTAWTRSGRKRGTPWKPWAA